jgi:hypothetical protein
MAHLVILLVIIPGVGKLESMHEFGEWSFLSFNQKMDMIRHKHIGVDGNVVCFAIIF